MARSLNKAQLIGNLTRDPELRYTPSGAAVCSFGIATNRSWTTDSGEKHEESEFHNIVVWNKLAEICSQYLTKGKKVYVEGRLATRSWTTQDNQQRQRTEVIIDDMIILDSKGQGAPASGYRPDSDTEQSRPAPVESAQSEADEDEESEAAKPARRQAAKKPVAEEKPTEMMTSDEVAPDDIPF